MKKCNNCKGTGLVNSRWVTSTHNIQDECPVCEGTGVPLISNIEEQYNEASVLDGTKLFPDEDNFIDLEDE